MYDDILVPTDGSDVGGGPIAHAIDLAATTGAVLHALYVVDSRDYRSLPEGELTVDPEEVGDRGPAAVADVVARAEAAGVDTRAALLRDAPPEAIAEYARENVDLVVMGTHGRTGLSRVLEGSVAERVVRTAPVPVLVVGIDDGDDPDGDDRWVDESVSPGSDGDPESGTPGTTGDGDGDAAGARGDAGDRE